MSRTPKESAPRTPRKGTEKPGGTLTKGEHREYQRLDKIVREGLATFLEVGRALMGIRAGKLYRAEFASFKEYVDNRHEISLTRAKQYIDAVEVVESLAPPTEGKKVTNVTVLPSTEGQCRVLTPLLPGKKLNEEKNDSKLPDFWAEYTARDAPVTARAIAAAVKSFARSPVEERQRGMAEEGLYGIHHMDFRELADHIPDASVDLIFTDPPYDSGSVPMYGELAGIAARVLVDGGSLICYCGHRLLPKIFAEMMPHLTYYWACACVHDGGPSAQMPRTGQVVKWKPMLWFVRGTDRRDTSRWIEDAVLTPHEKDWHEWQQGEIDAKHFVEGLSEKNDVVFDPFCGGGTTAVVAARSGRRCITCDIESGAVDSARQRLDDDGV